ncbi:MAG: metalloregulator ArsR/SmtB family transcription factor [Bellilinea sp.]
MPANNNGNRVDKERLYELFSKISSALANRHRLELLDLLVQAPRTVEELAEQAHMSVPNTSQHLQRLKNANLVTDVRDGQYVRYFLATPSIAQLLIALRSVANQQLADLGPALDRYRPQRHQFARISQDELHGWMQRDEAVLIDVRPEVEYQAGHLPGSISMPIDNLSEHIAELPKGKTVVAYCRGPYCVYADQALELLMDQGYPVARLEEGVAEWLEEGYPLET